jgi:hypothetical protein
MKNAENVKKQFSFVARMTYLFSEDEKQHEQASFRHGS